MIKLLFLYIPALFYLSNPFSNGESAKSKRRLNRVFRSYTVAPKQSDDVADSGQKDVASAPLTDANAFGRKGGTAFQHYNQSPYQKNAGNGNDLQTNNDGAIYDSNVQYTTAELESLKKTHGDPQSPNLIKYIVDLHNNYRKLHGVDAVTYNPAIASISQAHAQQIVGVSFEHNENRGTMGENLYTTGSADFYDDELFLKRAVDGWYKEITFWNFTTSTGAGPTESFTQIVWKETTEIGMGIAYRNGNVCVCVNYSPPGNREGLYQDNVLPPKQKT